MSAANKSGESMFAYLLFEGCQNEHLTVSRLASVIQIAADDRMRLAQGLR